MDFVFRMRKAVMEPAKIHPCFEKKVLLTSNIDFTECRYTQHHNANY
jgi:hypothetical protein